MLAIKGLAKSRSIPCLPPSDAAFDASMESARSGREAVKWGEVVKEGSEEGVQEKLREQKELKEGVVDEEMGITFWRLSNGVRVSFKYTDFEAGQVLSEGES